MDFTTTAQLEPLKGILGQERANTAMHFGLKIDDVGYNIYVCGEVGSGRTSYTMNVLSDYATKKNDHKDWCYVYNFENSLEPIALSFEKGTGKTFKKDMDKLKEELIDEIRKVVDSEEYEKSKSKIYEEYEIKKEEILSNIKSYAKEKGFNFKITKLGMTLTAKDENIDTTSNEFINMKRDVENFAIELISKARELEIKANERVTALEEDIFILLVEPKINKIMDKYGDNYKVKKYLHHLKDDIIENSQVFYLDEDDIKALNISMKEFFKKYKVNLFIDNSNNDYAPVVLETNPTYNNLFGKIEYENYNGALRTDFTKISAGAFHKANSGYLILYVDQVIRNAFSWDMIKRSLQTKEIKMDSYTSLKPEPIPIDIKIILIGTQKIYNLLYRYDDEFSKYFKIIVDFDSTMENNKENCLGVARFISSYCEKEKLNHFTKEAVGSVLRYSSRIAEDTNKLSTRFNKIVELLIEANAFSKFRNGELVEKEDVFKAIYEKWNRVNKIEKRIDEMFKNGHLLISVEGEKVGVINALSVINMGEYSFGRPSVITVNSSPGNKGIINIEREVKLSGSIHDKGVLIINGYLLENFSINNPVSVTATICFEQNYNGIDGDSASSAELYALLSSISQIPIKQNIAVTGSVNQKGEIQVVGGVTQKIEGFYYTCKSKGFTKTQGVILPLKNVDNLVLSEEVENAIKNGVFKLYPVSKIEEGIEILTGKPFEYIYETIVDRLKVFYEKSK